MFVGTEFFWTNGAKGIEFRMNFIFFKNSIEINLTKVFHFYGNSFGIDDLFTSGLIYILGSITPGSTSYP
jgi:hypothetical protein